MKQVDSQKYRRFVRSRLALTFSSVCWNLSQFGILCLNCHSGWHVSMMNFHNVPHGQILYDFVKWEIFEKIRFCWYWHGAKNSLGFPWQERNDFRAEAQKLHAEADELRAVRLDNENRLAEMASMAQDRCSFYSLSMFFVERCWEFQKCLEAWSQKVATPQHVALLCFCLCCLTNAHLSELCWFHNNLQTDFLSFLLGFICEASVMPVCVGSQVGRRFRVVIRWMNTLL